MSTNYIRMGGRMRCSPVQCAGSFPPPHTHTHTRVCACETKAGMSRAHLRQTNYRTCQKRKTIKHVSFTRNYRDRSSTSYREIDACHSRWSISNRHHPNEYHTKSIKNNQTDDTWVFVVRALSCPRNSDHRLFASAGNDS